MTRAITPGGLADRVRATELPWQSADANVGDMERWASGAIGGILVVNGLRRGSFGGLAGALLGGSLLYRAFTGHCTAYSALGIDTAEGKASKGPAEHKGELVVKSFTINRPAEDCYKYWRDFTNLPRFMDHLESVEILAGDGKRSRWTAKAPLGAKVTWDAEVIADEPNRLIAWQSLEGADIKNAGSVRFKPAPGGRGTEVSVELNYEPPAGKVGAAIAKLLGEEPDIQVREDLRRFKQVMETGEIATTEGQTSGRLTS